MKLPPSYISLHPSLISCALTPRSILKPLGVGIELMRVVLLELMAARTSSSEANTLAVSVVEVPGQTAAGFAVTEEISGLVPPEAPSMVMQLLGWGEPPKEQVCTIR